MQPKIIVSKNQEDRDKIIWEILKELGISEKNSDLLLFDEEKIGVKEVKKLISHFSTRSFGNTPKSAVFLNGNSISIDAQNALLKTLEEPPENSIILIGVDSEQKLLPTILSRCVVENLEFKTQKSEFDIDDLINKTVEERFEIVEKAADKNALLENITISYRSKVLKGEARPEFLEELLLAQIWNEANVNSRTILEYLMLKLNG